MRKFSLVLLSFAVLIPSASARTASTQLLSVAELEQMLASAHGQSDGALTKAISEIRLTERLSPERAAKLQSQLPGRESREQLLAIAAESSFLDSAQSDQIADPRPDREQQAALLAKAVQYVDESVKHWPNFYASRATTRFEGTATVIPFGLRDDLSTPTGAAWLRSPAAESWNCPGDLSFHSHRLDVIERVTLPALYRQGRTVHVMGTGGEFECSQTGVNTAADFDELSVLVPLVASLKCAKWSHWEHAIAGAAAVFRYAVSLDFDGPAAQSREAMQIEGELAFRPSDGAMLRLTMIRRWKVQSYSREYDTALEFVPVVLAGTPLLLPSRRVAIFLTPILKPRTWDKTMENTYRKYQLAASPLQEYLNEVRFGDYRPYSPPAPNAAGVAVNRP